MFFIFLFIFYFGYVSAELDAVDRFDVTAVHMAAENGHVMCVRHLLDAGADCNVSTKCFKHGSYTGNLTHSRLLGMQDETDIMLLKIKKIQIITECLLCDMEYILTTVHSAVPHIGGTTPLHLATRNNHIGCIKELILNGADYNAVDQVGRTSLYIASELGYEEAVLTHLRNAIGRDILSLPVDDTGLYCDLRSSNNVIYLALSVHTGQNGNVYYFIVYILFLIYFHFCVSQEKHHYIRCVRLGMQSCVEELLKHGSDVNHMNNMGFSPLHISVHNTDKFSFMLVKTLILKGHNSEINLLDSTGRSNSPTNQYTIVYAYQ